MGAGIATAAAAAVFVESPVAAGVLFVSGLGVAATGALARCPACRIAGVGSYTEAPMERDG